MISFEPRIGKVQTGKTSGWFAVIIPLFNITLLFFPLPFISPPLNITLLFFLKKKKKEKKNLPS